MSGPSTSGFRAALWLCSCLSLMVYKAVTVLPVSPGGAASSLFVEAAFMGLILGSFQLLAHLLPRADRLLGWVFGVLMLVCLTFFTSHAYFFASAAERRFSPLDVDLAAIGYFFSHVLPLDGLAALLATALVSFGGATWISRRTDLSASRAFRATLAVPLLASMALVGWAPRVPSPVMDMAYGVVEDLRTPRLDLSGVRALPGSPAELDLSAHLLDTPARDELGFARVLVFVMETMTAENFERERKALPSASFVNAMRSHSRRYTRYFPSNQDSRTGMLGMLSSRLIPYEAYTEVGRDHYLYLAKRPSLVDAMRARGYQTAFAVSQDEIELVVGDMPWQRVLHLDQAALERARKAGQLCFVPYEFEHSCEDLALLPQVLELIDQHPRLFLYQEFVWGHASEYNEASGKTNTAYYSQYLDAVVAHLSAKGLLEDTLIVLTSDHGFRDTSLQGDPEVVRIPLLFHAPRFAEHEDERLFAHMDFAQLLFHALAAQQPEPRERPFTLVVGPTGSSFVLGLTRERELMWFKTSADKQLLLRHVMLDRQGKPVRALEDTTRPAGFLKLFYDYRAHFDAQGIPATP
ncbi:MAG: sulfatase-like hydrolase/transferase [Myxococcales bacterium]